MAQDSWRASNWTDKVKVWFAHPGWRPADVAARYPKPPYDLYRDFVRFRRAVFARIELVRIRAVRLVDRGEQPLSEPAAEAVDGLELRVLPLSVDRIGLCRWSSRKQHSLGPRGIREVGSGGHVCGGRGCDWFAGLVWRIAFAGRGLGDCGRGAALADLALCRRETCPFHRACHRIAGTKPCWMPKLLAAVGLRCTYLSLS